MNKDTLIVQAGRHPEDHWGTINPPVYRASTIAFPTVEALEQTTKTPFDIIRYGRHGTPTTLAFEEAVAALEGGFKSCVVNSGLAAITATLMAFLKTGDHLLMVDTVYGPTRHFCDKVLSGLGIETTYYDPLIGAGIAALIRPETKVIFVESPGSLTFEIQDIPAIAQQAHEKGAIVVMDNTWGAGLFFKAFEKGVDLSIQAATKYIVGHSDALLGTITAANEALWLKVKSMIAALGLCAGSEECYLGLRGLRTLSVRLNQHQNNALQIARWLESHDEVISVLYPALASHPQHDLWKRDFSGACGLFGVILRPAPKKIVDDLIDGLQHFGLGYSWGGYESLVIPALGHAIARTATTWNPPGNMIRLHIGLEDPQDLIEDLAKALERYRKGRIDHE